MSTNAPFPPSFDTVLKFWFEECTPEDWFKKSDRMDAQIKERFGPLLEQGARGELWAWRERLDGRLAEVILLDQFSRNAYRDRPASFAQDPMALVLAQEALRDGRHLQLPAAQRSFLYMPFMHSESARIHERAVELFSQPGLEHNLDFELRHKKIIDRFGRYPHRNTILGRESTPAELEFLKEPGSSF